MLILVHLTLMTAAFVCLAAGAGMALFGRRKKNWLVLHKRLNTAGAAVLLAGGATAFANVVLSDGRHLAAPHAWVGLTAIILTGWTLFLGFYSFKAANKAAVRTVHRWSGRGAMLFLPAALILGLKMIGIF